MMEFLKWTFEDMWHFLGVIMLIYVIGEAVAGVVHAARRN